MGKSIVGEKTMENKNKQITMPLDEWETCQRQIERLTSVNKELIKGKKVIIFKDIEATFGVKVENQYSSYYPDPLTLYSEMRNSDLIFPKDLKEYEDACISLESHNKAIEKLEEVINDKSIDVKKEFESYNKNLIEEYDWVKEERNRLKEELDQAKIEQGHLEGQLSGKKSGMAFTAMIVFIFTFFLGAIIF